MSWMLATVTTSQAGQDRQGVIGVVDLQTLEQALTAARTPTTGNVPPVKGIELRADIFATDTIRLNDLPPGFVIFGGGYRIVARHAQPALRLAGPADLTIQDLSLELLANAPAILCDTGANTTLVQNLRVKLPDGSFLSPLFTTTAFANNLIIEQLTIEQGSSPTTAIELLGAGTWSACIVRQVRGRTVQITAPTLVRCRFLDLDSVFQLSPVSSTDGSFAQIKALVGGAFIADMGAGNTLVDFSGTWASLWGATVRQAMLSTSTGPGPGSTTQTNLPGRESSPPVAYNLTGVNPSIDPRDSFCSLTGNGTGNLTLTGTSALAGQLLTLFVDVATLGGLVVNSTANQQLSGSTSLTLNRYASLTLRWTGTYWQEISRSTR